MVTSDLFGDGEQAMKITHCVRCGQSTDDKLLCDQCHLKYRLFVKQCPDMGPEGLEAYLNQLRYEMIERWSYFDEWRQNLEWQQFLDYQ